MCFTESKGRFDAMSRPDFKLFSSIFKSQGQFPNHVTALISEQFLESRLNGSSCANLGKQILQKAKAVLYYIKWYRILSYGIVWSCMVVHGIVLQCRALYCIAQHCMVLHGFVWYCCMVFA